MPEDLQLQLRPVIDSIHSLGFKQHTGAADPSRYPVEKKAWATAETKTSTYGGRTSYSRETTRWRPTQKPPARPRGRVTGDRFEGSNWTVPSILGKTQTRQLSIRMQMRKRRTTLGPWSRRVGGTSQYGNDTPMAHRGIGDAIQNGYTGNVQSCLR